MSKNRRRPQRSKRINRKWVREATWRWEAETEPLTRGEPEPYVPDDWQEAWGQETLNVCRLIYAKYAWQMYPAPWHGELRADLEDWIWEEACKFANRFTPIDSPTACEHWQSSLYKMLREAVRWHWGKYTGASDEARQAHNRGIDSINRLEDMHREVGSRAFASIQPLWANAVVQPENTILEWETLEEHINNSKGIRRAPATWCSEPLCTEKIAIRGMCKSHYEKWRYRWLQGPCSIDGCERTRKARGLCNSHYDQARAGEIPLPPSSKQSREGTCSVEGCDQPIKGNRLCRYHNDQRRKELAPPCSESDCDRPAKSKGLCQPHYRKVLAAESPPCTIEGCDKPQSAKGVCAMHRKRQLYALNPPCSVEGCDKKSHYGGTCSAHSEARRRAKLKETANE